MWENSYRGNKCHNEESKTQPDLQLSERRIVARKLSQADTLTHFD